MYILLCVLPSLNKGFTYLLTYLLDTDSDDSDSDSDDDYVFGTFGSDSES